MLQIIDANNLAGKLGLLACGNFDKILASKMAERFGGSGNEIVLVFDSADPLGDCFRQGNIRVIYTPRDDYYRGADDKILELIVQHLASREFKQEIRVVTDDLELKNKVKEAMADSPNGWRVALTQASDFASLLEPDRPLADEKSAAAEDDKIKEDLLRV